MSLLTRLDVSLLETKNFLKVTHDEDDEFITDLIQIAKEQTNAFLNNDFEEIDEETGELKLIELPFSIKLACLKMIATWYEIRTDNITSSTVGGFSVSFGEIPLDSERLLHPYRKFVGV